MNEVTPMGFTFRFFGYSLRIWKNGIEYGNKSKGRVYWFPWHPAIKNGKKLE